MAAYKDLVGQKITKVTSNPSEPKTGQMWYNSTSGTLRGLGIVRAWSSASPLSTARSVLGGFGIQTSSVMYGGTTNSTEEYNGTGFSAGGNLNTGRPNCQDNGWGVETAGVVASGYDGSNNTANVEEYDGSSFSEVNNVSTARRQLASIGLVQTAGAICGGYTSTNVDSTEEYDGTNWTSGGSLNTSRRGFAGSGTLTAGIVFGGYTSTKVANTEEYDGTSWTTATSINTARNNGAQASNAPQSTAMLFGGNTGSDSALTEQYDGTSWTEVADMATARDSLGGSGIGTAALAAGGDPSSSNVAIAEEFTQSTNTITAAAWAAGGTVPYASRQNMSFGTQTAAIACGGHPPGNLNTSVSYDGTSYSSTPNLNSATRIGGVAGTQAAGYEYGGIQPPGVYNANTQTWNGSSWSNSPYNLNNGTYGMMSCGTSTAALSAGGEDPGGSPWNVTEEYDGEGWTSGNTMPVSRYYGAGDGTQTSAFIAAGSAPVNTTTLEYDGTNWATGGSLLTNTGAGGAASGENSDSGLVFGGTPAVAVTQGYDGTSWSTRPSLGTGRGFTTGNGTATAALIVSGGPPSGTSTATEEFTGETTAANITDFSTE